MEKKERLEELKNGVRIRENLIELKKECRQEEAARELLSLLEGDADLILGFLKEEESKVRKNAAALLRCLRLQSSLQPLYDCYQKEQQLFVRSSYLSAMSVLDYRPVLEGLKERLQQLQEMEFADSERKHLEEEMRLLSGMIVTMEGVKPHEFRGYRDRADLILLTNRNHRQITLDQVKERGCQAKLFTAGVLVRTEQIKEVLDIRTWSELLFPVPGCQTCSGDPAEAAAQLAESGLLPLLERLHKGKPPFYFRIECRSRMELDKRAAYVKRAGMELERLTGRQLINHTSRYEIELRLIANQAGTYNVLLKLLTLPEDRFAYRKHMLAVSIQPVNAALSVRLAGKYLKEGARVLDPFCGTGTMLIERQKFVKADTLYGVDLFGKAVEYARENTEAAGLFAHYINRDFFDFTHEYLFDEIITNFPAVRGKQTRQQIEELYRRFFRRLPKVLRPGGILILYTHNMDLIRRYGKENCRIEQVWELSQREGSFLAAMTLL